MNKPLKSAALLFKIIVIICSLLTTGYYRDFVFKTINGLLKAWDFDVDYVMPSSLRFLENYEYDTLVNIKWLLTFLFSFIYLIIALITIKIIFNNKKYLKITIGTYIGITALSGIFILTGHFFHHSAEKMYEFARYFMGMAQSPIILMILIPAFKISEKEFHNSQSN
ncbi:MAG: hypothetical protein ACXVPU_15025 [Bacteroidia bacterium]